MPHGPGPGSTSGEAQRWMHRAFVRRHHLNLAAKAAGAASCAWLLAQAPADPALAWAWTMLCAAALLPPWWYERQLAQRPGTLDERFERRYLLACLPLFAAVAGFPLLFVPAIRDSALATAGMLAILVMLVAAHFPLRWPTMVLSAGLGGAGTAALLCTAEGAGWPTFAGAASVLVAGTSLRLRHVRAQRVESRLRTLEALKHARRQERDLTVQVQVRARRIASLGHDLRQPLHALALLTGAMSESPASAPFARELATAAVAIDRLCTVLEQLLDSLVMDVKLAQPDLRLVPLAAVFAAVKRHSMHLAEAKGLGLRFRPTNLALMTDERLLLLLVQGLVDNAIKFTEQGAVHVSARRDHAGGDGFAIEVRDSGCGMSAEELHQLRRRKPGSLPQPGSSSLGPRLSAAHRLADALGAQVRLRSSTGRGTTAAVHFELGGQAVQDEVDGRPEVIEGRAALPASEGPLALVAGTNVLVLDDNPLVLSATERALAAAGACVCITDSPEAAFTRLRTEPSIDLLIVDEHLEHRGSGLDFLMRVQAEHGEPPAMMIVTAERDPAMLDRFRRARIAYCIKPVSLATLVERAALLLSDARVS